MNAPFRRITVSTPASGQRQKAVIEFLRAMVVGQHGRVEQMHSLFLDDRGDYLGDAPLGQGADRALSLRMRELFSKALGMNARGMVIAHNHPSGQCWPSQCDIEATKRIRIFAEAVDIQLVDHLIFTRSEVYSMRAGGNL